MEKGISSFMKNGTDLAQSWEKIGISNDFLFGKLMKSHPRLYRNWRRPCQRPGRIANGGMNI